MIRNYLKIVFRNVVKNKLFSFINILGLTVGLSATGLLVLYVSYELSYDDYHSKADQIYRLNHTRFVKGEEQYTSATAFPEIGLELARQFEAIEGVARMFDVASEFEPVFGYESNGEQVSFSEASLYLADSTFLEIFDVKFIESTGGNPLSEKNTLVISKSLAVEVFKNTNVVGKLLDWKGMGTYEITGVFEDLPANSHMKFEVLVSWFNVYGDMSLKRWDRFYNYVLVNEKADIQELAFQIQQFSSEYLKEYNEPRGMGSEISLQPLRDIHLTSKLQNELQPNGDKQTTYGLLAIAFLILFLAVINYVNLSTSKAIERAKEVGIRKVIGALKAQLIGLFLLESLLLILVSTVLAITVTQLIIPHFNQWLEVSIEVDYWNRIDFWLAVLISVIFLTVASGLYPAFIMSSFKPISLVKGIGKSNNKFGLRSLLISFQFAISLFLIVCTIIMYSQVSLVSSQETGFRKDQVVVINLLELLTDFSDTTYAGRLETLKDRLKAFEIIKAATVTSQVPGKKSTWRGTERASNESSVVSYRTRIDSDFAEVFNIPLVAGRFFTTEDEQNAKRYMVVNESWVKATGFSSEDEAVGQITDMGVEYEIIGVLADFHQISPKYAIDPAIFTLGQGHRSYMSIAFKAESYQQVLQAVEQEWKRSFPDRPFKYFFLDDHFEKQFKSEARMSEAVSAFTLFSLFLACLGLVGLSTTIAYQKVKELGIRKVLGASVFDLLKLLSKGYLILVFFGSAVGLPLAYMVMDYWITGYAVKVQLSLIHFGLPVATVMLLTLLSTLSQSVNAAIKNPTDSLRQE